MSQNQSPGTDKVTCAWGIMTTQRFIEEGGVIIAQLLSNKCLEYPENMAIHKVIKEVAQKEHLYCILGLFGFQHFTMVYSS